MNLSPSCARFFTHAFLPTCAFVVSVGLQLFPNASIALAEEFSGSAIYQTPMAARSDDVQEFDTNGDGVPDLVLPAARCNEGTFKPTICWQDIPSTVKYRPTLEACGGDAAILLSGAFANAYSVVLRDRANRDRFPPCVKGGSNYGGCSYFQCNTQGLNRCSAFKCQKVIKRGAGKKREQICCLGDSGNSSVLSKATRMTIKLRDVPGSNLDPLVRLALKNNNPTLRLN
jgi:hypothetical protein